MFKTILAVLQAMLFLISSFSVSDSKFKRQVDYAASKINSEVDFGFDPITAAEMKISDSEKQLCREWYDSNVLSSKQPAYDFKVGGKSLSKNIADWDISVGEESELGAVKKGGKTTYITLKHKKSAVVATVEATIYEEYASCEWTVYIKNCGSEKSPVIKDFYAANTSLATGSGDLYFSKASDSDADDFTLYKTPVNTFPMYFSTNGGRNGSFMPYFNISGKDFGAVMSVGWTGQWRTDIRLKNSSVLLKAKQENFNAYLLAEEEIRSPLVALSFYRGGNAVKGFNTLRKWETECVCNDNIKPLNGYVIANEFSKLTTDDFIDMLDHINPETLKNTDYFWMDAGWYEYNESWFDGVGNWIPDKSRFPDGLKPLGDKIASMGKRFLLWYEPERVRKNTVLFNEGIKHDTWIVEIKNNLMWNLGDDEAFEYLCDYISKSLVENGVTMYRQDFNFIPCAYWEKADKDFYSGRKGICENHYVTNLYKYLDRLCDTIDGLIIDNCASGGTRLDIEMMRRSLPLWRSDYNCGDEFGNIKSDVLEATQAMTYGISCWIPYNGTNRYFHSEYASRTTILTNQSVYEPAVDEYAKYSKCSEYMTENYYPLTYGGLDLEKTLAMQFGNGDEGTAIIYKREKVESDTYTLRLNGLYPEKTYELYDIDECVIYTVSGAELMNNGLVLSIKEAPKAAIIMYRAV